MLGLSICVNALSDHGTCTAIFVAISCFTVLVFSSIRTLSRISWLAIVGVVGIVVAGKYLGVASGFAATNLRFHSLHCDD